MELEVEYRRFCLVYNQVYNEIEPLKINEVLKIHDIRRRDFSIILCILYKCIYIVRMNNFIHFQSEVQLHK